MLSTPTEIRNMLCTLPSTARPCSDSGLPSIPESHIIFSLFHTNKTLTHTLLPSLLHTVQPNWNSDGDSTCEKYSSILFTLAVLYLPLYTDPELLTFSTIALVLSLLSKITSTSMKITITPLLSSTLPPSMQMVSVNLHLILYWFWACLPTFTYLLSFHLRPQGVVTPRTEPDRFWSKLPVSDCFCRKRMD